MAQDATPAQIAAAFKTIDETYLGPALLPAGPKPFGIVYKWFAAGIGGRVPFAMHLHTGGRVRQLTMGRQNFTSRDEDYFIHSIGLGLIAANLSNVDNMQEEAALWVGPVYLIYTKYTTLLNQVARVDFDSPYSLTVRPIGGQQYLMLDVPMTVHTNRKRSYV